MGQSVFPRKSCASDRTHLIIEPFEYSLNSYYCLYPAQNRSHVPSYQGSYVLNAHSLYKSPNNIIDGSVSHLLADILRQTRICISYFIWACGATASQWHSVSFVDFFSLSPFQFYWLAFFFLVMLLSIFQGLSFSSCCEIRYSLSF